MPLPPPPPIDTARTRVRLVTPADLPALMAVNGDDEVTRFLPYATWASAADADAWYQRMQAQQATGGALQFVLADATSDRAIGSCLLFRHDEGSARAELGYVLGRAHWGRGLMHEALHALIGQAFGPMGLRRLEAEVQPDNLASLRVAERLGFVREGQRRQRWVARGQAYDVVVYGLLRGEQAPPAPGRSALTSGPP